MQFGRERPIFLQIASHMEERVLSGELPPEERVPAVRDVAVALEVNPNTVVRAFSALEQAGVIFKKRGLGYFVAPDARARIIEARRAAFVARDLPGFVRAMILLGIGPEEVSTHYEHALEEGKRT